MKQGLTIIPVSRLASVLLLASVLASPISARDWFVDNLSGSDSGNGTRVAPLKTIAKALQRAETGDRLVLNNTGQPYRESITIHGFRHSGTSFSPFQIVGNGAVLDGRKTIDSTRWELYEDNIFRFRPPSLAHQMLYRDDVPAPHRIVKSRDELSNLETGEWALFQGWLYFAVDSLKTPANYNLSCCALTTGITLYDVQNVKIEGLYVQGFQLDGVNCHDLCDTVELASLNCRGNGRSGVSIGGASRCRLNGVVLGDNYKAQFRSEGYSKVEIANSELIDNRPYGPPLDIQGGQVDVLDQ